MGVAPSSQGWLESRVYRVKSIKKTTCNEHFKRILLPVREEADHSSAKVTFVCQHEVLQKSMSVALVRHLVVNEEFWRASLVFRSCLLKR